MKSKSILSIVTLLVAAMAVIVGCDAHQYAIGRGDAIAEHDDAAPDRRRHHVIRRMDSTGNYESLRDSITYEWMDWSQDGCSSPPGLDLAYAEDFHFLRTGTVLRGSSDGVRHPQAGGRAPSNQGLVRSTWRSSLTRTCDAGGILRLL